MAIGISGFNTTIAQRFCGLLPESESIHAETIRGMPTNLERYLICTGFLAGDKIGQLSRGELIDSWEINYTYVARACDEIIERSPEARICIIGSESGISGSYDMAYAGAKAAIHLYIETKKLAYPRQQIVGIAPTIIWDSSMTQRRGDKAKVEDRAFLRRRGEWLDAADVAKLAHFVLYQDRGNICNTIIRMTGGI